MHGSTTAASNSTSFSGLGSTAMTGSAVTPDPSIYDGSSAEMSANKDHDPLHEWHPPYPRLVTYHDSHSLAAAWGIGPPTTSLESARPTGASQAQSPSEDDAGDGKSNEMLLSCPAFRNELGIEPIRRLALCRANMANKINLFNNRHSVDEDNENWQREHTASETGVLEDVSNVYLGGRLCASRQSKLVTEPQDIGSYYYRHCFAGRSHINYFGTDEHMGPMAISLVRETSERKEPNHGIVSHTLYRMILRISDMLTMRVAVPEEALSDTAQDRQERSARTLMRELLEIVCPQIPFGCLRPSLVSPKVEEMLLKIDEQPIYTRYKVGVLYCRAGQSTEEQMYNNENSSPAFEEFLDFLGNRVKLKGFDSYKGGLDTRGGTTGEFSIYTEYHSHELMFHVSTMLPFTPNNKQQLSRKRHIGNDMVTIIFQEPDALPFSPITVRSHFQHVFIVIRVNNPCTENVSYGVAVSRAKDVPVFGPPIQPGANYQKCAEFHDFLLTKIINAENAVHRSKKFAAMAARTRREALKDLAENYVTAHSNEGPSRIASRFLGGSVKRKERQMPKPSLGANVRGALSWMVDVHDYFLNQRISCILGVSADTFVLLEIPSGAVLFATPTHSIIGWANTDNGLKIYYDHADMLLLRCCASDGSDRELNSLLKRLEAVTNGDEARELILRKTKANDALGFHIQEEGVVTDVDMYQTAWKVGLRQGSRIVEMEGMAVATLSLDQMRHIFEERSHIRILMVAPASDGNPRRGCEDPNCPAVKGQDVQILTPGHICEAAINVPRNDHKDSRSQSGFSEHGESLFSSSLTHDRKKISAPVGSSSFCRHPAAVQKKFSNSVHDQLCEAPLFKELNRAQSDDILGFPSYGSEPKSPFATTSEDTGGMVTELDTERHLSFDDELAKYQWWLQKTLKEKRELELLNDQLKAQLAMEKRSHENTRRQLELLQQATALSLPEGDEEL
ncbi:rap/ran-GAP domain-containing protein [Ditylenchus destructor]|nr:rap/ran-GAP domain-containing protein [Ditylenchus destructor]